MKKILIFVVAILMLIAHAYSSDEYVEPITLWTEITGVSHYPGLGYNLFPVATSFQFLRTDIDLFKGSEFKSKFYAYFSYGFSNTSTWGQVWDTGKPYWSMTRAEYERMQSGLPYDSISSNGEMFQQYGNIELWFGQPFVKNPIEHSEYQQLFEFRLGHNIRYTASTERLGLTEGETPTYVDVYGNPRGIYSLASQENPIVAWPWLNGNHQALTNYLFATLYFYPYRQIRESVHDGVYGYLTFEYGPSWLMNNLFPSGYVSSDYYRAIGYFEQKLTLLEVMQDNGWNWFSIYFGHSDYYSHTGGSVIPVHKGTGFYLSDQISDRFWFHLMLPNFIAGDCFSYVELSLYNNIYWGNVLNATEKYEGLGYTGSFNFLFHLRLFGFIRIEYDCSYTFAQGLNASYPSWYQRATINFYVSV